MVTLAACRGELGDPARFDSPRQMSRMAGYNLVEDSSGKNKSGTKISKRGRKNRFPQNEHRLFRKKSPILLYMVLIFRTYVCIIDINKSSDKRRSGRSGTGSAKGSDDQQ